MEQFNVKDKQFRGGDSGPKYLIQGPFWEGGELVFKPGQKLGAHLHNKVEETFYFLEGSGKMVINDTPYDIVPGEVFRVSPGEKHDIINDGKENIRGIFIKCPHLPDDKVKF